jgi:hypothetical protein
LVAWLSEFHLEFCRRQCWDAARRAAALEPPFRVHPPFDTSFLPSIGSGNGLGFMSLIFSVHGHAHAMRVVSKEQCESLGKAARDPTIELRGQAIVSLD